MCERDGTDGRDGSTFVTSTFASLIPFHPSCHRLFSSKMFLFSRFPVSPVSAVLKPKDELRDIFLSCGVDLEKPVVTTCGSGITACILGFGLQHVGKTDFSVYDGSWSEWVMKGGEVWTGKGGAQE